MYSQFYDSDVIIASPLGLRLAIEKDRDSDFLSSIELLVADQLDVMLMQNWEHVDFVMQHMNKIPKEAHGADFSRIKQWYLDSLSPYLRQTVLLSSFDSPEIRKLARHSLNNIAGKVQLLDAKQAGVMSAVRAGIRQSFQRFACSNVQLEANLRLDTFLSKTLPTLLKSALSSSRTLIFVPSYLDFLQLQEALRTKHPEVFSATAMLTEYSEGSEIARHRARFMTEKKKFLIVTERFVFYRRYVLRGARTIVWYGLPDHAHYYSEMLENVFKPAEKGKQNAKKAEEEEEVDPSDVSAIALFCQYDFLRLERIVGSEQARRMVRGEKNNWRFA
jgi:U3 small nucleolar RNA-associated protein 25